LHNYTDQFGFAHIVPSIYLLSIINWFIGWAQVKITGHSSSIHAVGYYGGHMRALVIDGSMSWVLKYSIFWVDVPVCTRSQSFQAT